MSFGSLDWTVLVLFMPGLAGIVFIGMVVGFSVGMLKLAPQFTPDGLSAVPVVGFLRNLNPLYFNCLLLAFTVMSWLP